MIRRCGGRPYTAGAGGFTLLEMMVVLILASAALAVALFTFTQYNERTAARRAAELFARDLTLARSSAARSREAVTVRFYEVSRWYMITAASGRELTRRRYGTGGDIRLDAIDLALPGDSVAFDDGGVADLSGGGSTLGQAVFTAGPTSFSVYFNALGVSKLEPN